jgi:hypothetical protein
MAERAGLRSWMVAALLSATALAPATAWAQGGQIRVQTDLEYILSSVDRKDKASSLTSHTDFSYFKQKYDIQLQKDLFPYLSIRGGGLFELIDSTTKTDGFKSGFDQTATRYFAQLDLNNPVYKAGTAYRRRKFVFDPLGISSTTLNRDEISGLWKWSPVGLPSIDLDFSRFHTWDDENTRDQEVDLLVVKTRYDYQEFASDYTYTRSDQDEAFLDNGSLTQIHNGGLRYSTDFFRDRLEVTGAARLNYDTLEPTGSGDIQQPTSSPGAEFYLLDDSDPSTLTVVNAANPLTNVNIGRDGPMNDVAVGLDFGPPTEVDTVYILPLEDQTRPELATPADIAAIAGSFVWRAFISDDQLNWREQTVTSAFYSAFDNRFEISFSPDADAPFVKIVTTPLFNATKRIEIAELRAFTTIPGSPGLNLETFTQTYNLGLRWAATANTTAAYEGFVRVREADPFNRNKTTLTNGVSLQHDFTPRLYGDLRVLRTDTMDSARPDGARHTYSASLTADYLPTLNQTLVYSGNYDQEGDLSGYANSILLRTNADLYRDWSLNLDLGYAARAPLRGEEGTSTSLRLSTNIAPNSKMYGTVDYLVTYLTRSDGPSGFDHNGRFQVFWVPIPSLSLFASVALRDDTRDQEGLRVAQDYSINWAPFPDGLLTFNLAYNETIDTQGNELRVLTPKIELQITRRSLLTVSFDWGTIESEADKSDLNVLRVDFRSYF